MTAAPASEEAETVAPEVRPAGPDDLPAVAFAQNRQAQAFWEAVGFSPRMVQMTAWPGDVLGPKGILGDGPGG